MTFEDAAEFLICPWLLKNKFCTYLADYRLVVGAFILLFVPRFYFFGFIVTLILRHKQN